MVRTSLTAIGLASIGLVALLFEPLALPGRGEDLCRVIVISQAGIALGFLIRILAEVKELNFSNANKVLTFMTLTFVSYFLLTIFVAAEVISYWNVDKLTWRAPLACMAFSFSDVSLYKMMIYLRKIVKVAHQEDAVLELSIMDSGKPGPNIDLSDKINRA